MAFHSVMMGLMSFCQYVAPAKKTNLLVWMAQCAFPNQKSAMVMMVVLTIRTSFSTSVTIVLLTTSSRVCIVASLFVQM